MSTSSLIDDLRLTFNEIGYTEEKDAKEWIKYLSFLLEDPSLIFRLAIVRGDGIFWNKWKIFFLNVYDSSSAQYALAA